MQKPSKPTPDFSLFPHAVGQWAKKVSGQTRCYGPWSHPDAALARYQRETNEQSNIASPAKPAKPRPDSPAQTFRSTPTTPGSGPRGYGEKSITSAPGQARKQPWPSTSSRKTFQTIGEKTRDDDAVRYIMGHAEAADDMGAVYCEEVTDDSRSLAVTDYVRAWLFSANGADNGEG